MARRNTLLHFILGNAEPEARRAFVRILAAEPIDKLPELLKKHEENKKLYKKGGPLTQEDPLDMSPEEFEALIKVRRNPEDQISVSFELSPRTMNSPIFAGELLNKLALFYEKNKEFFDSPTDLYYDRKNKELHFRGNKQTLKDLLKEFGVRKEVHMKKDQSQQNKELLDLSIPLDVLPDMPDADQILRGIDSFRRVGGKSNQAQLSKDKASLLFKGTLLEFITLLTRMGLPHNDETIDRILQFERTP